MFFKSKPLPDEWMHLTPREVALCQKAAKKKDLFDRFYVCKKALSEGSYNALPIILPTVGSSWDNHLFYEILQDKNPRAREVILPALAKLSLSSQQKFLGWTSLADDKDYLARVLENITDENVLAGAICGYLSNDHAVGEKTLMLCHAYIDAGANVHYAGGDMLRRAIQKGQFDLAQKIISKDFDMESFSQTVYQKLVGEGASVEAIHWFKRLAALTTDEVVTAEMDGAFRRFGDDGVAKVDVLPSGARLTTIFNFAAGQQLSYISEGQQVSAPAVTSVSQLQNTQMLDAAIAAFLAQDGDPAVVASYSTSPAVCKRAVVPK